MIRLQGLDIVRGYAIVLMVVFHFSFDLNNFHYITTDIKHGDFWHYYRYLIVSMFVFLAGVSIYLANADGIKFQKLLKRVAILAGASALVTIGSYIEFPKSFIYFGILHFFLFSSIVGLLFLRVPKISVLLGIFIIIGYNLGLIHMHWLFEVLQPLLHLPIPYTEDLANIIPWFGVFLLGMSAAYYKIEYKLLDNRYFNADTNVNKSFAFLGRHSLIIYLIHQPIFFTLFELLKYIK